MLSKLYKKKKIIKGGVAPKINNGDNSDTPRKINKLSRFKNVKVILPLVILVLILAVVGGIKLFKNESYDGPLSSEQLKEYRELQESMRNSELKDGIAPSILLEINSSIRNGKFAEAKKQIEFQLSSEGLEDKDKRVLLTALAQACLPLKDFGCLDKTINEYGKLLDFDIHTLVEVARTAKAAGHQDKARGYYQKALQEIENRGGEDYVKKTNKEAQVTLSYQEIKSGAGQ